MTARLLLAALVILAGGAHDAVDAQAGSNATNVSQARGASTAPGCAIDANDTIHLAWADNPGTDDFSVQYVYYARSSDGGSSFEAPRRISTGVAEAARPREIRVVTSEPGVIVVAWWATIFDADRSFLTAYLTRSTDGGATFAPAVETSLRFRIVTANKEGFNNTTSLSLAFSPDGSLGMLATVPDYLHGFNLYFVRSADGTQFSEPKRVTSYSQVIPRAASSSIAYRASGDAVVVWTESRGDFTDELRDVFSSVSTDRGQTFSAPEQIGRVRGIVGALLPTDGGMALLVQSQKNELSKGITKYFRSRDGGRTYSSKVRIVKTNGYSHLHQNSVMASSAANVVAIAWTENSPKPGTVVGIYVSVSHDGGRSFGEPELVMPGLFIDPPSVTVTSTGRVGVAFSSSAASLPDREVLFLDVGP